MIDSCIKENIPPIIIPKEEKGKYINYLSNESIKDFTKWGVNLSEKEAERIEKFLNKEKVQLITEIKEKNPWSKVSEEKKIINEEKQEKNPWIKKKSNEKGMER